MFAPGHIQRIHHNHHAAASLQANIHLNNHHLRRLKHKAVVRDTNNGNSLSFEAPHKQIISTQNSQSSDLGSTQVKTSGVLIRHDSETDQNTTPEIHNEPRISNRPLVQALYQTHHSDTCDCASESYRLTQRTNSDHFKVDSWLNSARVGKGSCEEILITAFCAERPSSVDRCTDSLEPEVGSNLSPSRSQSHSDGLISDPPCQIDWQNSKFQGSEAEISENASQIDRSSGPNLGGTTEDDRLQQNLNESASVSPERKSIYTFKPLANLTILLDYLLSCFKGNFAKLIEKFLKSTDKQYRVAPSTQENLSLISEFCSNFVSYQLETLQLLTGNTLTETLGLTWQLGNAPPVMDSPRVRTNSASFDQNDVSWQATDRRGQFRANRELISHFLSEDLSRSSRGDSVQQLHPTNAREVNLNYNLHSHSNMQLPHQVIQQSFGTNYSRYLQQQQLNQSQRELNRPPSAKPRDRAPSLARCKTQVVFHELQSPDDHDGCVSPNPRFGGQNPNSALRYANSSNGSATSISETRRSIDVSSHRSNRGFTSKSFDSSRANNIVNSQNHGRMSSFDRPDSSSSDYYSPTSKTQLNPIPHRKLIQSNDITTNSLDASKYVDNRRIPSEPRWYLSQPKEREVGHHRGQSRPYLAASNRKTTSLDQYYNYKLLSRRPMSPLILTRLESEGYEETGSPILSPHRMRTSIKSRIGAKIEPRFIRQVTTTGLSKHSSLETNKPEEKVASSDSELYWRYNRQHVDDQLTMSQRSNSRYEKYQLSMFDNSNSRYDNQRSLTASVKKTALDTFDSNIQGMRFSERSGSRTNSTSINQNLVAYPAPKDKKSSNSMKLSFTGARRRLGFKHRKGLTSLSVQRSEEILPRGSSYLVYQHASTSSPLIPQKGYGFTSSPLTGSCSPLNINPRYCGQFIDPRSSFSVDGLGCGQFVMRQALVAPYLGDIQLSLSDRRGMLEVEVVRARGLQLKPDATKLPCPYVKIYLMKNRKCIAKGKTASVGQTLNPLYQQPFIFREDYSNCVLQVIVWGDYGRRDRKSLMGIVQIRLDDLDISDMVIGWYRMFNIPSIASSLLSSKALRHALL